jgi:hypothetical protein
MLPWSGELADRLEEHVITSELLRENPFGDTVRTALVGVRRACLLVVCSDAAVRAGTARHQAAREPAESCTTRH